MNGDEGVLNWFEERNGYSIAWEWEDGPGLYLGENSGHDDDHAAATAAARLIGNPRFHGEDENSPLIWETQSAAKKALKAAKAAVESFRAGLPMPDWAVKALSEGWTPPKGWKQRPNDGMLDGAAEQLRKANLIGGATAWDAAGSLAASGTPSEALARMCRDNATECRKQAGE